MANKLSRLKKLKLLKEFDQDLDDSEVGKRVKHIVMFSGGLSSFVTAHLVCEKFGKENVMLLFSDTKFEHSSLYTFVSESAEKLGCQLVTVADGRNPWDVFFDERFIGNTRVANCSRELKAKPMDNWLIENFKPWECICYFGFDITEIHRYTQPGEEYFKSIKYRKLPYYYDCPLMWKPYTLRESFNDILKLYNIDIPYLYTIGAPNNNCNMRCVKGGIDQRKRQLKYFPEIYKQDEELEQKFIKEVNSTNKKGKGHAGLVRIQTQEAKKNKEEYITLKEFREIIESSQLSMFDQLMNDESQCGCFV